MAVKYQPIDAVCSELDSIQLTDIVEGSSVVSEVEKQEIKKSTDLSIYSRNKLI